ncbi:cytochrome C oxidase subunit IV family protein [Filibacter tadaridae]|uniref:Cytochrome c oxidase subunit 4B n=1 Tax=Filibacter tadaridae TaxID=2483811 RepID=A0A3P5XPV5_9BACL|nr:cytochrome C oxidase subunit IV family protein [Filibacter tadaridae]VDC29875.1 Cytochrome c oxidase subunit 4B [Filibacter tadaridae]
MAEVQVYKKSPAEFNLGQRRAKKSMRNQIMMFALMIFLTLISFTMVMAYNSGVAGFSEYFVIPILLLFAAVQVGLQLYFFMHMSEKGHGIPMMFMYTGALFAFLIVLTFVAIVWW